MFQNLNMIQTLLVLIFKLFKQQVLYNRILCHSESV